MAILVRKVTVEESPEVRHATELYKCMKGKAQLDFSKDIEYLINSSGPISVCGKIP